MVPVARVAALISVLGCGAAQAGLVEVSYTEQAISWNGQMNAVAAALGLDAKSAYGAKQTALNWVALGPCKQPSAGSVRDSAVGLVVGAGGTNTFDIAVLAMIGVLSRENLGREPPDNVCRFAKDLGR